MIVYIRGTNDTLPRDKAIRDWVNETRSLVGRIPSIGVIGLVIKKTREECHFSSITVPPARFPGTLFTVVIIRLSHPRWISHARPVRVHNADDHFTWV